MIYGWEDLGNLDCTFKKMGNVKQLNEVGFYYRIKIRFLSIWIDQEKGNYYLII
jgi:hypothetical protein